ncbi:LysR substrate-binding domain-containing protein [Pseudomonas guariconensis]|uniref:choline sulfate utilization transcriptional regulator n=1 Tax=Pseudomonas TaxID=286 RepID=UPI001CE46845|nr:MULTISPECIES: LysR substrate-binding domain-containing protein [Pseudomonas]MCO7638735.1 LysR substrate-binding domain-containing protein [Pseudomonas sp. S 311-6]MCO7514960.1 LysR substrate-binding domain-containing protein [Pseudomonas putida]MCO7564456.1 LysR substrate-binding domain-containing protein [Pseudomonas mosselii]MCO7595308.1 LysR substrate-binding domain-containing protein [Pseudomonas guariconensis]MCO7604187.1 LysR substrate-binding domain-containing protein [Pseudomonas gu
MDRLPLELLRAFESAARHQSFTAAAVELGTTQPAVSQQIKRLEALLEVRLFDRVYRGINLTEGGAVLLQHVQAGLGEFKAGIDAVKARQPQEVVQVATDYAFAALWLMPRLPRLRQRHPHLEVSIQTSERSPLGLRGDIDLAIVFGDGRFKHGEALRLFGEEVFPVCSPMLLNARTLPLAPSALAELPLLHLRADSHSRWYDWPRLFRALGIGAAPPTGLSLDNYSLLIQAAIAGQGVAIGWRHLVDDLIRQNLLCRPLSQSVESPFGYYAILPERKRRARMLESVTSWLMEELGSECDAWASSRQPDATNA